MPHIGSNSVIPVRDLPASANSLPRGTVGGRLAVWLASVQPVNPFEGRCLEKQCGAECRGGDDREDDNHSCKGLAQRGTQVRQLVECVKPFECADDEDGLHQSGYPRSADKKQSNQEQRSYNTD